MTKHTKPNRDNVMSFNVFKQYASTKTSNQPVINTRTLMGMLKSVRPANGHGEKAYIDKMLSSIRRMGYTPIIDTVGNIIVNNLPTVYTNKKVLTVHRS